MAVKTSLELFTQCYVNKDLMSKGPFQLYKAKSTSVILALILSSIAVECEQLTNKNKMNTFVFSSDEKSVLKDMFPAFTTDVVKKAIAELQKCLIIERTSPNHYRMNPFVFARGGDKTAIIRCCNYCLDTDSTLTDFSDDTTTAKKTKDCGFSFLFNSLSNLANYACFTGNYNDCGAKLINGTELLLFLLLTTMCTDCNFASSPELCNIVTLDNKFYSTNSKYLGVADKSLRRSVNHLVKMHLLYKIEGEHCKYMVNPYIAARGNMSNIRALQINLSDVKYQKYFDGCAMGDTDYYEAIAKRKAIVATITVKPPKATVTAARGGTT